MNTSTQLVNLQGNRACALAAIAAGCRFYAGYPITPSTEIAETMAAELPKLGGVFIQMEDEIASMAAVVGASMGGAMAMTATSGPGFSLKQENLGYASAAEIPCVVVNVMRGGPSTGMPTRPAQGDVMQARWGTHGDHPIIVLTPASVPEIHAQTRKAFELSERFRIPVVVLYDEVLGHLVETVELGATGAVTPVERRYTRAARDSYQPYAPDEDGIPVMARPGDGYRTHTTGLTHDTNGFPTQDPVRVARIMERLLGKTDRHRDAIEQWHCIECDDAEVLVVAYGISARAATHAVHTARARGIAAGLFRPITLWPFPERAFAHATRHAHTVLVPELNAGQLRLEIERLCAHNPAVHGLHRLDGETLTPAQILADIERLAASKPRMRRVGDSA